MKNMLWIILAFTLTAIAPTAATHPGANTDSLITSKKEFTLNEKIEFTINLNKHSKNHVRLIPTMSCSCGNKDFYYKVYRIADAKNTHSRTIFLDHSEKPDAKRCTCKTVYAEFYDNTKRIIPSINAKGNYFIIIEGYGFIMSSDIFTVTD